jgi:hypothetical protein
MFDFKRAFSNFSATSAMTAAAAGIFVGVIAPLAGGLPKAYEVQEFGVSFVAFMNGEASAATGPAFYPRPNAVEFVPATLIANRNAQFQTAVMPVEAVTLDGEPIEVAALPEATTISDGAVVPVVQTLAAETEVCADDCEEGFIIEAPQPGDEFYEDIDSIDVKEVEGVPS